MHQEGTLTVVDHTDFWKNRTSLQVRLYLQPLCLLTAQFQDDLRTTANQTQSSYIESSPVVKLNVTPVQRDTSTEASQPS